MFMAFGRLDDFDCRLLQAKRSIQDLAVNEVVFREGDIAPAFYQVESGRIALIRYHARQPAIIATLKPGDVFGESVFLVERAASAHAVAMETTRLGRYRPDLLEAVFQEHPALFAHFFQSLALITARRLRAVTDSLGAIPEAESLSLVEG